MRTRVRTLAWFTMGSAGHKWSLPVTRLPNNHPGRSHHRTLGDSLGLHRILHLRGLPIRRLGVRIPPNAPTNFRSSESDLQGETCPGKSAWCQVWCHPKSVAKRAGSCWTARLRRLPDVFGPRYRLLGDSGTGRCLTLCVLSLDTRVLLISFLACGRFAPAKHRTSPSSLSTEGTKRGWERERARHRPSGRRGAPPACNRRDFWFGFRGL